MLRFAPIRLALLFACCLWTAPAVIAADDGGDAQKTKHLLRYQLKPGQEIHFEVEHLAKTKTRIRGTEELSNVRTVSTKVWRVVDVNDKGEMTFEHLVADVEMSQQHGEGDEMRWSSNSDQQPPAVFRPVAAQLGKVIAQVRINGRGQELDRQDDVGTKADLGMGGLTLPLPEEAIAEGSRWSVPREIRTRAADGKIKVIEIRELYTLEKVQTGVATISVRSEPLTVIDDAKTKSQVVQQLSNGTIRFDVDAGRLISKQLDWDETVVGFEGAESLMEYRARLTETLIEHPEQRAAKKPQATERQ